MKFSSRKQLLKSADAELKRMRKLAGLNESLNEAPSGKIVGLKKISTYADDINSVFDTLMDKTELYKGKVKSIWDSVISGLNLKGKRIGSIDAFQKGGGATVNDPELDSAKILDVSDQQVVFNFASDRTQANIDYNFQLFAYCKCAISVQLTSGKKITLTLFWRPGDDKITVSRNRNIGR